MCKVLKISKSTYYYKSKKKKLFDSELENKVISIFEKSKKNYGARKIKVELEKSSFFVSRKKIRKIMNKYGLVSNYTKKKYRVHKSKCNNEKVSDKLERQFTPGLEPNVVVSDLTYVNVNGKWHYICILLCLYNREIIGYSAGKRKNAELVKNAFATVKTPLSKLKIFHTDRGSEFKNEKIDNMLNVFEIERSLSRKGNPYDNSVAEATFKIIKIELVKDKIFDSLEDLQIKLMDYVNWFNNHRIHGSLDYLTPMEYKIKMSEC